MKELSKEMYKLSKSPIRDLVKRSFAAARVLYDHDSKLYVNARDWELNIESEITALENQLAMRKDEIFEKVRGKATERQIRDAMQYMADALYGSQEWMKKWVDEVIEEYLAERPPEKVLQVQKEQIGKATEQQIRDAMEWIAQGILKRLRAKQKFDLESLCDQYLADHPVHANNTQLPCNSHANTPTREHVEDIVYKAQEIGEGNGQYNLHISAASVLRNEIDAICGKEKANEPTKNCRIIDPAAEISRLGDLK